MISPSSLVATIALGAALVASSADAGALPTGVCYSPWHHGSVSADIIQKDFVQVKQYFSGVRTFHAQFAGINAIDAAAKAGLKISVGVQMGNAADIEKEITAACEGAKRNPGTVEAIYVGNENLKNGGFGKYTGGELVGYITKLRTCISNGSIKIGSVQRINEWVGASDAGALAAVSDVIGVNIYPFFTPGTQSPIEKMKAQWKQVNDKYPGGKVHITETGYPRGGATVVAGNAPSKEIATSFLKDYAEWAKNQPTSYWFMMYDTKGNTPDYENFFGLADVNGVVQLAIPGGDGAAVTQAPAPAPGTPAPAPATQAPAPATQAPAKPVTPTTQAPANPVTPTTQAPANPVTPVTQAPGGKPGAPVTQAPANPGTPVTQAPGGKPGTPVTQAPGGKPGNPVPQAPGTGDSDGDDDSADGDAGTAPAATPAATKPTKPSKKDCHA
ncbi:hypothetical protein PybrP1_006469 [[Pythium] brassicae (nom. inval.)]|nr:hypothetical protein PybrP1_006469 [[Pythium] brassicae (nom. inval.)]